MTDADGEQRVVRLREKWSRGRAWNEAGLVVVWCGLVAVQLLFAGGQRLTMMLVSNAALAVVTAGPLVQAWRGAVVLSPQEYRSYHPRRRRLAWSDIAALTADLRGADTRVVAHLHDGGRVVLPFPIGPGSALGRHDADGEWFREQYRLLCAHWQRYSGGQVPASPPVARP